MTASHIELWLAIIGCIIGLGSLVFAAGRFAENVKANTTATEKLGAMIDGHLTWSAEIVREHDGRFHEHAVQIAQQGAQLAAQDTRITSLESGRGRK